MIRGAITWMPAAVAIALLAVTGCGSDDGEGGGGTQEGTPSAAVKSFFDAAAASDSAKACALVASGADGANVAASMLIAGTGSIVATGTDCPSTLAAQQKSKPALLRDALPTIKTRELNTTSTRSTVVINHGQVPLEYRATVVKQGSDWRIQNVAAGGG
jgi:hypothetical protein